MISTDFAPNEFADDALISFSLLFQPWRWYKGTEIQHAKKHIQKLFNDGHSRHPELVSGSNNITASEDIYSSYRKYE